MAVDETIVKLLAQSDGASTTEEAASYAEKAQKLATRYGIDIERARQKQQDRSVREVPTMRTITVGRKTPAGRGAAGNKYFVMLFSVIASSNDVKIDIGYRSDCVYAYGFPSDIEVCEALFNFLAAQMVEACTNDLRAGKHKEEWGITARDYKGNFYEAFRGVVSARLRAARKEAIKGYDEDAEQISLRLSGGSAVAAKSEPGAELVLSRKADEVESFYKKKSTARGSYGYTGHEVGNYSSAARSNGAEAGKQARISAAKQIGTKTQIGA